MGRWPHSSQGRRFIRRSPWVARCGGAWHARHPDISRRAGKGGPGLSRRRLDDKRGWDRKRSSCWALERYGHVVQPRPGALVGGLAGVEVFRQELLNGFSDMSD